MQRCTTSKFPLWGVWHNSVSNKFREQFSQRDENNIEEKEKQSAKDPKKGKSWSGFYRVIDLSG